MSLLLLAALSVVLSGVFLAYLTLLERVNSLFKHVALLNAGYIFYEIKLIDSYWGSSLDPVLVDEYTVNLAKSYGVPTEDVALRSEAWLSPKALRDI
ncbi:hypothetical protein [Hyperthermus butylicus]|uniref:hypothetical protein n=1 Tax=Hyperthermus butylicus TaxID=54248 RepID=UPI00129B66DD|nr:hypothetical protein [Hyperthermus butylicus]